MAHEDVQTLVDPSFKSFNTDGMCLQFRGVVMEGMRTVSESEKLEMDGDQAQQGLCEKVNSDVRESESPGVLGELPEVCIAMILSWLSPREVARLACVCRSFRAGSSFDSVWENILPPKYKDFLALDSDADPARFASKREIFDYLCNPMIMENNTQVSFTFLVLCYQIQGPSCLHC